VVDGSDARLCSIECAGLAHGVNRNACTQAVGFLDSSGQLRLGVLVGSVQLAVDQTVRPGLVDLGEVGTLLVLGAHYFNELLDGVGIIGVR